MAPLRWTCRSCRGTRRLEPPASRAVRAFHGSNMRRPPMHQDWQIIIVGGGVKELGMLSVSAPGHRRVRRARCEAETEGDPPARRCRSGARFLSRFSIFQRFAARKISLASPEPRFPARPWIVSLFTPAARGDASSGASDGGTQAPIPVLH